MESLSLGVFKRHQDVVLGDVVQGLQWWCWVTDWMILQVSSSIDDSVILCHEVGNIFYCMMCVYPKAPDHQRCNCKDVHCPGMISTSSLIPTLSMLCYVIRVPFLPTLLFFVCLWCVTSYFTVHLSQQNSTDSKGHLLFLHNTLKAMQAIAALFTVRLELLRTSLRMKKVHINYYVL